MEIEILRTMFLKVVLDKDLSRFSSVYLPATEGMTDDQWKLQMIELKKLYELYKPKYIIDDNRERLYAYSPDMQEWTLNLFIELWNKIGVRKYAQILPNEILGKLTSMQIEELAVNNFDMLYKYKMVEDYQSALNWINEEA